MASDENQTANTTATPFAVVFAVLSAKEACWAAQTKERQKN